VLGQKIVTRHLYSQSCGAVYLFIVRRQHVLLFTATRLFSDHLAGFHNGLATMAASLFQFRMSLNLRFVIAFGKSLLQRVKCFCISHFWLVKIKAILQTSNSDFVVVLIHDSMFLYSTFARHCVLPQYSICLVYENWYQISLAISK